MTKVEYVYRSLREEILVGTLPPGKRLLFADLAKRFGVSAIPVREAVRQLESDDLVEFKPHTRVEVKSLPFTEGLWALEVRVELEPLAARLATPLMTSERLGHLGQIVDDLAVMVGSDDHVSFSNVYHSFSETLFAVTPNRTLVELIDELRATSRRFTAIHSCTNLHRGSEEHLRGIHAALTSGDAELVATRVRAHRSWALDALRSWVGTNTF